MVCKGNGVNESPPPIEGGAVDVDVSDSPFPPNNFGTGPIAVVLLGGGVEACGGGGGGAAGLGGAAGCDGSFATSPEGDSAGGAEFNLFFLPQITGT
jgi:hypothetical protein